MKLMTKITIAQALIGAVEDYNTRVTAAKKDGHVTLSEAVTIGANVAMDAINTAGLADHVLHTTSKHCLLYTSPSPRD